MARMLARSAEEGEQRLRRFAREFLGDEVARRKRPALDLRAALRLPHGDRVPELPDDPALAPQNERVARDLFALGAALAVVVQVDAGAGAVVFARGVNGF